MAPIAPANAAGPTRAVLAALANAMASPAPTAAPDDTPSTYGIGQRVAHQRLERHPGRPERGAHHAPHQGPPEPGVQDDRVVGAVGPRDRAPVDGLHAHPHGQRTRQQDPHPQRANHHHEPRANGEVSQHLARTLARAAVRQVPSAPTGARRRAAPPGRRPSSPLPPRRGGLAAGFQRGTVRTGKRPRNRDRGVRQRCHLVRRRTRSPGQYRRPAS